jgi:DNA-binding NtrC family response regulator
MKAICILFVEDDPEMRSTYEENFLEPEFHTTFVKNGFEALKILSVSAPFDVVVTDNYMLEMDIFPLLNAIRRQFPRLVTIVLMGYGNSADDSITARSGGVKFLEKPVRMSLLRDLIRASRQNELHQE